MAPSIHDPPWAVLRHRPFRRSGAGGAPLSPSLHGTVLRRLWDRQYGGSDMDEHKARLRASDLEDSGDVGNNPTGNPTMGEVIATRFNRRDLLRRSLAVAAISATVGNRALAANEQPSKQAQASSFDFKEIEAGVDQTHH